MKYFSLPAAVLLGTAAMATQAQTAQDTLLVTATRTAQTADQALASVTVIERDEIERKQAQTVTDLLRQTPGITVTNNGGRGKQTSIFMRGTNSDHVLVLIDGIKQGSATLGSVAFEHLTPDQIERIEVVRGPRSSLYGSEAIGGVIQIFTRKGSDGLKPRFSVGAGSNDSREVALGVSGGNGQGWYNLSVSDYTTDGFDAKEGTEADDDGYDNRSYALSGGYRFNEVAEAELFWTRNTGDSEFDGSFQNESSTRLQTLGGTLRLDLAENWQVEARVGRSQDEGDNYLNGTWVSNFDTQRDTLSLQSSHQFSAHSQFVWGVDYQDEEIASASNHYAVSSRDNTGAFGLYQLYMGAHDIALSLRHDDNEQFGGETTGSLAWGVALPHNLRLTASYGTAFRAPTFNDLYWPGSGNPDLQPEESDTLELGLSGDHAGIHWAANLYQTDIDNMIAWAPAPTAADPWRWTPMNVDNARIRGLELTAATRFADWDISTGLDLLDPKDRETDEILKRRPRKVFTLAADRDFGGYALGGTLQAVGKRKDRDWMSGYTVVDLRGSYALSRDWSLKAKVENLLDEDYQTARGYNQPDRTYWLSLHYAP
ncbi:TonB-dependent vitamin B12 receptor [Marinobacterium marinum]|uniref:TonB-dependent vitamin B12 receptor n=1 Tax=Marinobacterium marinum TaxID=2756129 RepID=A0A7W1X0N4_9GAMM|nr:TonB-dependent vitamin B12 receptor [Marinobacterium marinum]MBA4503720.1 TonB-dependent vitamin B12 receptor [Marinobacterium marinum]